jgi:hypothetical protein
MKLLDRLEKINRDKDLSQIEFLNENLDSIFIEQMRHDEIKDFRFFGYPLYSLIELDDE